MKSNKSIICYIVTLCFSIGGLFSETTKNKNFNDIEKIKQYTQLKERAKQKKQFNKRIDHQKKPRFAKKMDINKMLQVGSSDIEPNWDGLSRSATNADSIYILINGSDSIVTVTQFDSLTLSVTFSNGQNMAKLKYGIDMNNNGIWEEALDHLISSGSTITDNNYEDKNSADGIWEMTWGDNGPQYIADLSLFILVEDGGGSDVVNLVIEPKVTDYSISGNLVDESDAAIGTAHMIVQAFSMDDSSYYYYYEDFSVGATGSDGSYQLYLHDAGTYNLMMYDAWSIGNLLLDYPYYEEIQVDGHETGYDFTVLAANAWIDGYVKDDDGNPVSDAQIEAWSYGDYDYNYDYYGDGNNYYVYVSTDSAGYFNLPVLEGEWEVNTYNYHLIPDYMDTPNDYQMVTTIEDDTVAVGSDFMIYKTDATISGNIYLDGALYTNHAMISSDNGFWDWDYYTYESSYTGTGYTFTETTNGSYSLSVASEGDSLGWWGYWWDGYYGYDTLFTGYNVNMDFWSWGLPENVILSFDELYYHSGVQSGSTDINFYLTTVSGGIEGVVTNDLGEALEDAWIYASGFIEGNSGDSLWYWNDSYTDEMGSYTLYLPSGDYEIRVDYWDYDNYEEIYCSAYFDVSVGTSFTEKNIELTQVTIDGSISGQITDKEGYAIYGHYVYVQGDGGCEGDYGWYDYDYTDEYGNYHMDLPNGNYTIWTWDYCSYYGDVTEDFVINGNDEIMDFAVCEYYDYDDVCGCWYENEIDDCGDTAECWVQGQALCEESGYDDEYSCENAGPCMWEGDCDGPDDGLLECIQDCPGIDDLGPDSDPIESCSIITAISDDSCTDDCGWEESMMIGMMELMCDMYDECIDEGYSESVCEEFFDMDDGSGDEEEEGGPPECIMDCEGVEGVNPDDTEAFCEWIIPTLGDSNCAQDCDAEVTTYLTEMFDICSDCISAGNCDEADLSADEKNLLLPEEFALHLVYPNPFNPTTDIGFSLKFAGPVSIFVYDVTGRQIETILHNEFQNAGSHIISWNGSKFPSGIYFIHLQAGRQVDIQKVTLLK